MSDTSKIEDEFVFQALSASERRLISEFLRISSRPETGDRATEQHLMTSLSFAMARHSRAC